MSTLTLARIPVAGIELLAVDSDGVAMTALRPLCEHLGVDYSAQLKRLKARSWATVAVTATVAADGKPRNMAMVDRRTLTMWLATIDERRVSDSVRPTLVRLQAEAADALDAYFHQGSAVQAAPANQFDVLRSVIDQLEATQREASEAKQIHDPVSQEHAAEYDAIALDLESRTA